MRDLKISTRYNGKVVHFVVLLAVFFGLYFLVEPSENNVLWRLPPLIAGLPFLINDFASYLMYDFMPIENGIFSSKTSKLVIFIFNLLYFNELRYLPTIL